MLVEKYQKMMRQMLIFKLPLQLMKLSDFDYNLPRELIAQKPAKPRNHSRLLVLDKKSGKIEHKHFYNIIDFLQAGDVLVLNNSKVFPARLIGNKKETGGKMEVFLHRRQNDSVWQCMLGGRGAKVGLMVVFNKGLEGEVIKNNNDGTWEVKFNKAREAMIKVVNQIGQVPLPPYIKRHNSKKSDVDNYQTVYADKIGSVAAPTAGLHFTPSLLKKIKSKGVKVLYVTLHVGLGTFSPVKVDDLTKHKMHAEWVEIKKETLQEIIKAKKEKKRIVAVGTTSARTLESFFSVILSVAKNPENWRINHGILRLDKSGLRMTDYSGWTDIFIYPGYKFKVVDSLITNFHLPKSSLIMLISALAGSNKIKKAYREAIKKKYRFYSYGDAMFIY